MRTASIGVVLCINGVTRKGVKCIDMVLSAPFHVINRCFHDTCPEVKNAGTRRNEMGQ